MTKGEALHNFFSSFGLDAYASAAVPEDVTFPYLTYDSVVDTWGSVPVSIAVNLWFYTESEAIPNAKAQRISETIGMGGKMLPCDGGAIWITRGSPWCQNLMDDTAANIKRRYLNVTAEYLTMN